MCTYMEFEILHKELHIEDLELKSGILFSQEITASTNLSSIFSDLSWCHLSYEGPI